MKQLKTTNKLIKSTKIRWFSLFNAIIRIIDIYPSINEALKEIELFDVLSVGIASTIRKYEFIFFLNFLDDLMGILNIMNKAFQKEELKLSRINMLIICIENRLKDEMGTIENIKNNQYLQIFLSEYSLSQTFKGN